MKTEEIEEFVESFVREHFPNVSPEDKHSLHATGLIYIWEHEDFSRDEKSLRDLKAELKRTLKDDYSGDKWRTSEGRRVRDDATTEDISNTLESLAPQDPLADLRTEVQDADKIFEGRRDELKEFLPPILFEAFLRLVDPDTTPQWTIDFSDESLKVLCWRAIARIGTLESR